MTYQQKRLSLLVFIACVFLLLLFLGLRRAALPLDLQAPNAEANAVSTVVNKSDQVQNQVEASKPTELVVKEFDKAERDSLLNTLPSSLQDIPPPEKLEVDENNELIINLKIRRLFDFYLSALGEEELETLVQRIKLDLEGQLPEPALGESLQILEGYLQYKQEIDYLRANTDSLGGASLSTGNIDDILLLKQNLRASRSKFLSPEVAEAFFAAEDQYDDYQIEKSRILGNQSLSSREQQAALDVLKQETPTWLLEQEQQAQQITRYQKQLKSLQENQASEAEITQLREQQFGPEASQRLNQLDQERADWNQRLEAYRKELLQSVQGLEIDSDEFVRVSENIRSQHYLGNELIRVRALDELHFAKQ